MRGGGEIGKFFLFVSFSPTQCIHSLIGFSLSLFAVLVRLQVGVEQGGVRRSGTASRPLGPHLEAGHRTLQQVSTNSNIFYTRRGKREGISVEIAFVRSPSSASRARTRLSHRSPPLPAFPSLCPRFVGGLPLPPCPEIPSGLGTRYNTYSPSSPSSPILLVLLLLLLLRFCPSVLPSVRSVRSLLMQGEAGRTIRT